MEHSTKPKRVYSDTSGTPVFAVAPRGAVDAEFKRRIVKRLLEYIAKQRVE